MSPTVSTTATGTAKFNIEPDGNMAYQIDKRNLNGVIGAHISLKNGTDLAQVFNFLYRDQYGSIASSKFPLVK
jgi:hypothetical protein